MRAASKVRALVVGTVAAGTAVLAAAPWMAADASVATLALLGAAVVVMELIHVPGDESSGDPGDAHSLSFSSSVHIATVLIVGPWTAAVIAAFGVLVVDRLRGSQWRWIVYNASVFALAAWAAGYVFRLAGGTPGAVDLPGDFPALAALAAAYYGMNTAFMSAIVGLESGKPLWPIARETSRDGLASGAGEAGLGIAIAFFAVREPWAIVALAPLLLALYRSYERLATLRRQTAHALETFANVVDERDASTFQHSARVADYVRDLAEALELPAADVGRLRWAGRLHDLGKIAVDAAVLRKPSRLDDDEWAAMQRHPRLSARLLRRFQLAANEARAVEYHHERFDGAGYYGVDSSDIPLAAHFLMVADSYDAMTSDRAYRRGMPPEQALAEIETNSGSQFHPAVARAFVAMQRGLDPLEVLTSEEREEIRMLLRSRSARGALPRLDIRSELAIAGGVVVALAAVGFGVPLAAAPALAFAAIGFALNRRDDRQARRLAARLRGALGDTRPREETFVAVAAELSRACELRWAGLLSWKERECSGRLELQWSSAGHAPGETAVTSWIVREAESTSGLIMSGEGELERDCTHVAAPLRRDGVLAGFLVLGVPGRPQALERALREGLDELSERLLPREARDFPRLEAIAS
jgi:putative nucleotidyltransferase with HDIG domain